MTREDLELLLLCVDQSIAILRGTPPNLHRQDTEKRLDLLAHKLHNMLRAEARLQK